MVDQHKDKLRILIVDDEPVNQKVLKGMLSKFGECVLAGDGAQGLRAYQAAFEEGEKFDLVLLDIMMPNMDGQALLRRLRRFEVAGGVPESDRTKVIMTTACSDAKSVVQAFRSGCESYVTKPIDRAELVGEIRKLGIELDKEVEKGEQTPASAASDKAP